MTSQHRNTALRNRMRARFKAAGAACHICGRPIDYDLKSPDPMSFEVDHLQPIAKGGTDTIDNAGASHRTCNSKKRARDYAPIIRRSGSLD